MLSLLRQEKGVSQRVAAEALQVSQALLSHYEKGSREPGYAFLLRAADYYGVSTDYLLGRTPQRGAASAFGASEGDSEAVSRQMEILQETYTLLCSLLSHAGTSRFTDAAAQCMAFSVYKLIRYAFLANAQSAQELFSASSASFSELSDAQIKRAEAVLREYAETAHARRRELPPSPMPVIRYETLVHYAPHAESALTLLHAIDEALRGDGAAENGAKKIEKNS